MNNRKNDIAIPELELSPEFEIGSLNSNITVLVKHDYYSSDNDHGKKLLSSIIDVLCDDADRIGKILIIDSGVKLLTNEQFLSLLELVADVKACDSSLDFYKINISSIDGISLTSPYSIAAEILDSDFVFTIE